MSKTQPPESTKEENKKKPVLGKLGNLFSPGRRKHAKYPIESSSPPVESKRSVSPHKETATEKSIGIADTEERSETLQVQGAAQSWDAADCSSKGASSDEWSPGWNSSNETIKNTFFASDFTLEGLELGTDLINSTTPDFLKSLNSVSCEDLENSILNHKQLVNVQVSAEPEYAESKEFPRSLESKASGHTQSTRVLKFDIYLRKTEETLSNESVASITGETCGNIDTMDKKPANRRSGKRRKSQSSSDTPNGERNQTDNSSKDDSVFVDDASSDAGKINSERKMKSPPQTPERNSFSSNQDLKVGSSHKGFPKAETDKSKQQASTSAPFRRRSLKKNQSDIVPVSPTGSKGQVKDSVPKRQSITATESNSTTKNASVEKGTVSASSGENNMVSKVVAVDNMENSTSSLVEGRTESKTVKQINSFDGRAPLRTERIENGELGKTSEKLTCSDSDSSNRRTVDGSRTTVTTKISLPAKPKNVELNFKAPISLDNLESEQESLEKAVNKTNNSIANKISLFENKCSQNQRPTDVPVSKNSVVSNAFVGRAKLKFGKQATENGQPDKIIIKQNSHQKFFENGTQIKEDSAEIKVKLQEGSQAGTPTNEEAGRVAELKVKAAGSLFNQTSKVDACSSLLKQSDAEPPMINNDSLQPKSLNESKIFQDNDNQIINVCSKLPQNEKIILLPKVDISSPCNDKYPLKSVLVSKEPELQKIENDCKKTKIGDSTSIHCTKNNLDNEQTLERYVTDIQQNPDNTCNGSAAAADSIFDSPTDMKKFAETIKNLDSSICVPQKKKRPKLPKSPAPYFAMPPIHEDNLEKIFDPNIFTLGLGVKREKKQDLSPAQQIKMQSLETIAKVRPKRISTEQSILFQSLKSSNRNEPIIVEEINGKENNDSVDGEIKRSRLEKSSLYSSLLSSVAKEKITPATSANTIITAFAADSSGIPSLLLNTAGPFNVPQKSESLSDKVPSCMEKYFQMDDAKKELGLQMPNCGSSDKSFSTWLGSSQYERNVLSGSLDIEAFSANGQNKINPRPGKMVICSEPNVQENNIEVFYDILDCSSWVLSPVISVKVIRGCWILYEKPNFEGASIPLEEGELELTNIWDENTSEEEECKSAKPAVIGSIKHVVKDYRVCRIDLYTEPEGSGIVTSFFDDTEEMGIFGKTQKTCSIKVLWGVWLIYEEPGFQGIPLMLEPGEYPNLAFWEKKEAYIRSMRPLKMGGRKVEHTGEPKVVLYEKPFFEGRSMELESEILTFTGEEKQKEELGSKKTMPFTSVGSIKVLGGLWVAYEKPRFAGHQYLLEEGAYQYWKDWGGYSEDLQSLRPVLGDFASSHMIMYSEENFGSKGANISVLGIISNLKDTGYGLRTKSINVLSGVWVIYENPDFTGEQYILDKGLYPSIEAWGGKDCKISSVQPIVVDAASSQMGKFKVQLFSEPEFKGSCQIVERNTNHTGISFATKSSKVLAGNWIAYDREDFSGNQYVLEEGVYPTLSAMGCPPQTNLQSLQVINIELSEPCIALFEKEDFQGKKIAFTTEILNLQFLGYNPQIASIQVSGGIWVIYEHSNYRGRQMLLSPNDIPNWYKLSGYHQIGSLRPLLQKLVYFRLRNKKTGQFMSTDGNLDNLNLLRIQVSEDKSDDQIWVYQDGFIKCRMVEEWCLTIVGNLITPGSKLGLSLEQNEDKQYWHIHPDGRIYSKMKPELVLDIKGGTQYDQNHVVVNTVNKERSTQCWEPLIA
ncbi:beta/gamma crystallin domain-containing protein 1 isoform X2 [Alligator mississippiensis]|uniref:beta/gamma crystallin domain-containing protein 1 isoform X2 n=1 Tax=Alligator mississippiensis TaxID=8496 RepID=UPI000711DFCA|nr:beta/gamma crystallin domain-containing protein 1 isoform X2 [Alligator mississippiensis]